MASSFPAAPDSIPDPSSGQAMNAPPVTHSQMHTAENDAIEAVEGYLLDAATVTTTTTAVPGERVLANAASAAFTVTLPSDAHAGVLVAVEKIDSSGNAVTVACPVGWAFADGSTSVVLSSQNTGGVWVSDGVSKWVVQGSQPGAYEHAAWSQPSPLGSSARTATDLFMSAYDTNLASTDHTAAFQSAIAAAASLLATGVSMVRIILDSRQKYSIGGAVTAGSNGQFAQIPLPYSQTVSGVIQLVGMPRGNDHSYISLGQSGTVIESTLAVAPAYNSAVGIASIFGGPASYGGKRTYTSGWSYIKFATRDITIRSASPVICGIDAGWLAGFSFGGLLQFDTDQTADITATAGSLTFANLAVCTAPQAIPIVFPFALDWYGCHGDSLVVSGWVCGPQLGEYLHARDVLVFGVPGAVLNVDASAQVSRIDYLTDWNNAYGVAMCSPASATPVAVASPAPASGNTLVTGTPIQVGTWNIQRSQGGPAPAALDRVYDLIDPTGYVPIEGTYNTMDDGGGVYITNGIIILGHGSSTTGYHLTSRLKNLLSTTGIHNGGAVQLTASNTPIRNPLGRDSLVVVSGGTGVTNVTVNGVTALTGDGTVLVPATGTIQATFSAAPTLTWMPS